MAKTDSDPKARAAGSNVGNDPPGSDDTGNDARRRNAQAGGSSVPDRATAAALDKSAKPVARGHVGGLSPEQEAMEADREEYGSQERGTGDKPPIVHGRTRPVYSAHDSVPRLNPNARAEGEPVTDPETVPKTRTVRALKLGYHDDKRRRPGDVFLIRQPYQGIADPDTGEVVEIDEFSDKWMEDVPDGTPLRTTTGKTALQQQHDAELAARNARRHGPASGQAEANPLGEE